MSSTICLVNRDFYREKMNTQSNTDVMQLFVIMASSIFGPSMSQIIGPYLLIVFAAATGAGWSLGRTESKGRKAAIFYFLRIVFTAILLTVAISKVAASYIDPVEAEWLIAPVALIIGLIGDDWYKVGDWVLSICKRIIDKRIDKR